MHEKEPAIDIRIIEAMEKFRQALDKVKEAQDPMVKEILRQEALDVLYQAANLNDIIVEASQMKKQTKVGLIPQN